MIIEGEKEYKVERLLNKRRRWEKWEYLVRWKGYTAEEDTWEKEKNLKNAKELIEEYKDIYEESTKRVKKDKRRELPGRYTAKLLYG